MDQDEQPSQHDQLTAAPPPRMAFNIPEFCGAFRISEDFYYKLKRLGQGPREMKIGTRTLISLEAATEWCREREAASAIKSVKETTAD